MIDEGLDLLSREELILLLKRADAMLTAEHKMVLALQEKIASHKCPSTTHDWDIRWPSE